MNATLEGVDPVHAALAALLSTPELAGRAVAGVWLFGSLATGRARADSDVDLAVLCTPPLGNDRFALMDRVASLIGRELDVIDLATVAPAVAWEVVTTGRLLHERDELAVESFVRHARFAVEDAARRDRMVVLASTGHVGSGRR